MDDPWANAWGEPGKPTNSPMNTWIAPAKPVFNGQDAEADLAMPSWATGAGLHWAEPSEDQATLWNPTSPTYPTKDWATSPYDSIPLGRASQHELSQAEEQTTSPEPDKTTLSSPHSSPAVAHEALESTTFDDDTTNIKTRSPTPTLASTPDPGSPDGFGTFETGLDVDEADVDDPWSHSTVSPPSVSPETDVWVPSWGTSDTQVATHAEDKHVDEWEAATLQKEKQDKLVPPHVLASILSEYKEFAQDLRPDATTFSKESSSGVSDFRSDRYRGLDGVEGLAAAEHRIIPQDLTLPEYVQFSKTFTAKHMAEALRLTRHVPITRASPFALYLASKGSTAWETSIKSRVEVTSDKLQPLGWRVLQKDTEETTPVVDPKKKATGGLLSFFGRKGPIPPLETTTRRSTSPVRQPSTPTAATASPVATGSARTSVDSVKSLPKSITSAVVPAMGSSSSNYVASPDPGLTSPSDVFEPAETSSAVSRFLNRFSRTKTSGSSSRNSFALSTDDIEFLSDIVPSANDDIDEASQLKELSNMIGSSPLPTTLPPPLAPPPGPPPISTTSSSVGPTPEPRPPPQSVNSDLMSLFDSPPKPALPAVQPTSFHMAQFSSTTSSIVTTPISPSTHNFAQKIEPQRTGSSSSSRVVGQSSMSFDFPPPPTSRAHTPLQPKRAPVAIMSTGSSSTSSGSIFALPPPPALAPPPNPKASTSELTPPTSRPSSRPPPLVNTIQENIVNDYFSDLYFLPQPKASDSFDTNESSVFSDQSLFSASSSASMPESNDSFDDFDDFVSSSLRTPSPPRLPAKPTVLPWIPPQQQRSQPPPLPPTKHPSVAPRKASRAANHQRTLSLVVEAAARSGRWPAPASPLPEALPPPGAPPRLPSNGSLLDSGSSMQTQQARSIATLNSSASSPALFPPTNPHPPGLSYVPVIVISPTPTPILRPLSPPNRLPQNGSAKPSASATLTPLAAPTATKQGGLSAQDLSFFEGL